MPILGASSGGGKPGAPTVGAVTAVSDTSATVAFTAPAYVGKGGTVTYTAYSSPGGLTGTSTTSPITVNGLTTGVAYAFAVTATTSYGAVSAASSVSNNVTPTLAPFMIANSQTYTPNYYPFNFTAYVVGGGGGGGAPQNASYTKNSQPGAIGMVASRITTCTLIGKPTHQMPNKVALFCTRIFKNLWCLVGWTNN